MAKGFRIASAYVEIKAEAGGLKQDAESKVRAALASLEGKVKLAVDGKTLRADAEKATKAATAGLKGKVDLDVDAKTLRAEMTAAVKAASAGLEAKIGADFDSLSLRRSLQEALSKARTTFDIKVNPHIDRDLYRAQVKELSKNVPVKLNTEIDRSVYLSQIRALSEDVTVKLNADLDRQAYIAQVMRMSRELEGKFRIAPDIKLMALHAKAKAAAESASGKYRIRFPVDLDEDSVKKTRTRMRHLTRVILGSFLFAGPAISAVTEAIQQTGAAAAVAVPMFTSLTTMVVAGVVAFEGMGKALQHADSKLNVFNKVIAELAPNAQEFARAFRDINPLMKELQLTVQNTMFKGLADQFRTMGQVSLPVFTDGLSLMATLLNDMASGAMDTVTELSRMGTLETMFEALHFAMRPTVDIPGQLLNAITKLSIAATPLLRRMTEAFGDWADTMTGKLDRAFADGRLQQSISEAGDTIVNFFRRIANNPAWQEFVANMKESGPEMAEAVASISEALLKLVNAMHPISEVVVQVAAGFAELVSAIPTELITTVLGVVAAVKGFRIVKGIMIGAAAGVQRFTIALRTMSMSTGIGLLLTAVAALAFGINKLAEASRGAPPEVDRLTNSLKNLSINGRVSGELSQEFGKDLSGLAFSFRRASIDAAGWNRVQEMFGSTITDGIRKFHDLADSFIHGEKSAKAAREDISSLDKSLANMVNEGHADMAAEALQLMGEKAGLTGPEMKELKSKLTGYKGALKGLDIAQQVAADSMGRFGDEAIKVQDALSDNKREADGLRDSIIALNEVMRGGRNAELDYEQALIDAKQALKDNGKTLNQHTQAGIDNERALLAIASASEDWATKSQEAGGSTWDAVQIMRQGRDDFVRQARLFGMNATEAEKYADKFMKIPDTVVTELKARGVPRVKTQLNDVIKAFKKAPDKKSIRIDALTKDSIKALEEVGFEVKKMPDGSFKVTAKTKGAKDEVNDTQELVDALTGRYSFKVDALTKGAENDLERTGFKTKRLPDGRIKVTASNSQAMGAIAAVRSAGLRLDGFTVTTYIRTVNQVEKYGWGKAAYHARGGIVRGYAGGGSVSGYPGGGFVSGPGTSTSDSIPAMLSDGEYVIRARMVEKYGRRLFDRLNMGLAAPIGFASGGMARSRIKAIGRVGKSGIQSKDGRKELTRFVTLSNESRMAGRWKNELVGAMDAASDLQTLLENFWETQKKITGAFKGRAQRKIMDRFESAERQLIPLQKNLDGVNKSLEKQQEKLDTLTENFDSLSSSIKNDLIGFGNITKTGKYGTSVNTLIGQLRKDTTRTGTFAGQLEALKAKGLNAKIIADIAAAGVTGGGMATATSLLNATPAQIAEINALQARLTANAERAGDTTAEAMYGAGIEAARGLVQGLKSQKEAIKAVMLDIAQSMENVIRRALGIHSPSRVMMELGAHSANGFALGLTNGEPKAAARSMARNVVRGASGAQVSGVAGTAGGGVVINGLSVNVHGTWDLTSSQDRRAVARALATDINDELRNYERARR